MGLRADTIFGVACDREREIERESEREKGDGDGDGQKGAKAVVAVLRRAGNECREIPGKQNKTQRDKAREHECACERERARKCELV